MTAAPQRRSQDLAQLLIQAERLLCRHLAGILEAEQHSLEEWSVMSLLSDGAGHHMTAIAERALLPPATLTKLLDHLVDINLVYRRIDDLDRRRIRAYLTPRGQARHTQLNQRVSAALAELPITDGQQGLLTDLLARLITGLTIPVVSPARPGPAGVPGRPLMSMTSNRRRHMLPSGSSARPRP